MLPCNGSANTFTSQPRAADAAPPHKQGENRMGKNVAEINEQIARLKAKRKKVLETRYMEVGKFLIKEYGLQDVSTNEIKEMIKEKML